MKENSLHSSKIQQKHLPSFLHESKHQLSTFNSRIFQSAIKTFVIFLINSSVLSDARQTKLLLYLNHVLKGTYFSTGNNSDNSERKIF